MTQTCNSWLFIDAAELGLNKVTPWNIIKTEDNFILSKHHKVSSTLTITLWKYGH